MNNTELLPWFGVVFLIVMAWTIIAPYLRGTSDLLTAWNLFLLGSAMFIGMGCFEVAVTPLHWKQLQWFQPTKAEANWYIMANTLFFTTIFLSYYLNPLTRALPARCLNKWPPDTVPVTLFVLVCCYFTIVGYLLFRNSVFLGPLMLNLSHKATVFASVFSFLLWYRNRLNLAWFFLFIGVLVAACLYSMVVFTGRRLLLSVLVAPVVCVYWSHVRYWRPTRAVAFMCVAGLLIFVSALIYSSFRWFSVGRYAVERNTANVVQKLKEQVKGRNWIESFVSNKLHYFAQYATHYSLLTQRYVANGQLTPKPFNSLVFIAAYPIPRRIWPDKPLTVSEYLVHEIVGERGTNWGLGIAGHGAYEGGLLAVIIYGFLWSFGIRFIDDPLKRQSTNPFLLSIFATCAPHVLGWSRGDIAIVTIECLECFFFAGILSIAARVLFGTVRRARPLGTYPPGSRLVYDARSSAIR